MQCIHETNRLLLAAGYVLFYTSNVLHHYRTDQHVAAALALFAAIGTEISMGQGAGPLVAIMLGVTTGVAGGMIRDVICNEIPLVLTGEIYATAAFAASVAFVVLTLIGMPRDIALAIAVVSGFSVRAAAIVWNLSLPAFRGEDN